MKIRQTPLDHHLNRDIPETKVTDIDYFGNETSRRIQDIQKIWKTKDLDGISKCIKFREIEHEFIEKMKKFKIYLLSIKRDPSTFSDMFKSL